MHYNLSFFVYICILLFCGTNALVEIISPAEIAGVYEDAPVRVLPTTFDITAELILPSVAVCIQPIPESDNFTNRIVFIRNVEEICTPKAFARKVLEHDLNTAGQIVACSGRSCSALGYLYTDDEKFDEGIYLPSLNVNDQNIIVEYLLRPDREKVIVRIRNTDYNPWLALGDGPAGVFTQVFFEIYAFVCLVIAVLKLYVFIKFQAIRANITQSCLWIEIIVAILRMLFMVGPLSFGVQIMPKEVSIWFVDTPNVLSLITTLLITFYWQEILSVISERLQNNLINRLSKFRWPFFLISLIILFTHIFSTINSILFFITDVSGSTYTVTAIIALLVSFLTSVFFFVIGYRVFKVSDRKTIINGERKATRVTIFIVSSAVAMMLRIMGLLCYVSPVAASGRNVYFFTWWLVFFSSWTISFTKILAFEPPPSASRSFGSYFRKPTRFFKYILNHYFGCHISTESDQMTQEMHSTSANEQGKDSGVYSKSEYEEESSEN